MVRWKVEHLRNPPVGGQYIVAAMQHFVALRYMEGEWEANFTNKTHTWCRACLHWSEGGCAVYNQLGPVCFINLALVEGVFSIEAKAGILSTQPQEEGNGGPCSAIQREKSQAESDQVPAEGSMSNAPLKVQARRRVVDRLVPKLADSEDEAWVAENGDHCGGTTRQPVPQVRLVEVLGLLWRSTFWDLLSMESLCSVKQSCWGVHGSMMRLRAEWANLLERTVTVSLRLVLRDGLRPPGFAAMSVPTLSVDLSEGGREQLVAAHIERLEGPPTEWYQNNPAMHEAIAFLSAHVFLEGRRSEVAQAGEDYYVEIKEHWLGLQLGPGQAYLVFAEDRLVSSEGDSDLSTDVSEGETDIVGGSSGCGSSFPRSALVIEADWCKEIFEGTKIWELRGQATTKRERICIAAKGTGSLVGEVVITDCIKVAKRDASGKWVVWGRAEDYLWKEENLHKHCVKDKSLITYSEVYAWVFAEKKAYDPPKPYNHRKGCHSWVTLEGAFAKERSTLSVMSEVKNPAEFHPERGVFAQARLDGAFVALQPWYGRRCVSVDTVGDGACGLHAAFGVVNGQGQLENQDKNCRADAATALREMLSKVDAGQLAGQENFEAIRTSLWNEFALPAARGEGSVEANIFWRHMCQLAPESVQLVQKHLEDVRVWDDGQRSVREELCSLCRTLFLESGCVRSLCERVGFLPDVGGEACYEERQDGRWVKGTNQKSPEDGATTKWEAIIHPSPIYDALRMSVLLTPGSGRVREALHAVGSESEKMQLLCMKLAETLAAHHDKRATAPQAPEMSTWAIDAYTAAVQETGYFFSCDEVAAIATMRGKYVVCVKRNSDGYF